MSETTVQSTARIPASTDLSIRQAAIAMDTSEQYIRQLLLRGKLDGFKDEAGKWFIPAVAVDNRVSGKTDKRAYIVMLTDDEVEVLHAEGYELRQRFDSVKAKQYRLRREANKPATTPKPE